MNKRVISVLPYIIQAGALFVLSFLIFNTKRYPVADDWLYVRPLTMESPWDYLTWLFQQEVDHRIPMQKLVHSALAQASGYDMRALMLFNAGMAFVASTFLIKTARLYRNAPNIGDAIIPLIILNPASGYSLWSIHLQFLSSILFVSLTLYNWCAFDQSQRKSNLAFACICLSLLPLCGMNGAIFSSVISTGLFAYIGFKSLKGTAKHLRHGWLLVFPLISNLIVWLAWTPSEASKHDFSLPQSLDALFKLLPASMFSFAASYFSWKSIIIIGLIFCALFLVLRKAQGSQLSSSDLILSLIICASVLVIVAVTIGRSDSEHLVFHYGNLTILVPVTAWIIISSHISNFASSLLATSLVILFAASYFTNLEWRSSLILSQRDVYREINYALNNEPDPARIVQKFPQEFLWTNDPALANEQLKLIVRSINTLRLKNYPNYALK